MNALGRFLFRSLERLFGVYREGPQTPIRYFEEVRMFRVLHPAAAQDLWERFADDMIDRAYRDAYVRGHENAERWWPGPPPEAERLAEAARYDWSLARQSQHWADAMARVGEPRTARQVDEARLKGHVLQRAYRGNKRS